MDFLVNPIFSSLSPGTNSSQLQNAQEIKVINWIGGAQTTGRCLCAKEVKPIFQIQN